MTFEHQTIPNLKTTMLSTVFKLLEFDHVICFVRKFHPVYGCSRMSTKHFDIVLDQVLVWKSTQVFCRICNEVGAKDISHIKRKYQFLHLKNQPESFPTYYIPCGIEFTCLRF